MPRCRLLFLAGTLLFLPSAAWLWLASPSSPTPGVSRANFDQIRIGMTEQEVEALMGHPPRFNPRKGGEVWWIGDEGTIFVELSAGDGPGLVVASKEFRRNPDRFIEKLRRLLPGEASGEGAPASLDSECPP
jgi:hypothetical protein